MTPAQRKTMAMLVGLGVFTLLVPGGVALWWELSNTHNGATFSETIWVVWATQPWVVWLITHMIAAPVWFLAGHFVAQSRKVYDDIRGGRG